MNVNEEIKTMCRDLAELGYMEPKGLATHSSANRGYRLRTEDHHQADDDIPPVQDLSLIHISEPLMISREYRMPWHRHHQVGVLLLLLRHHPLRLLLVLFHCHQVHQVLLLANVA